MGLFEEYFGTGIGNGAGNSTDNCNSSDSRHPQTRLFFAPGRVNLIGEHTDYTGGYVFPAAISHGTWAMVRKRADRTVRFASTSFDHRVECSLDDMTYRPEDGWTNYPKGVIDQLQTFGVPLTGFDILYHGNIPNGAGLSSSASIELVTAQALCTLAGRDIPTIELVQLSQRAENQFVGVNCGIMDQFAVGMGKANQAMLLRCSTLEHRYVPLQVGDYQLVIINTNKPRKLAESKYNERRQECEDGFAIIQPYLPHAQQLGDVTVAKWEQVREYVDSPTLKKRLQHVITENDRVVRSTHALEQGDLAAFGEYMNQSHDSLRDLYEVTGNELDVLVSEARDVPGCIGARMTGAGFGGCAIALVHRDQVKLFEQNVTKGYQQRTGLTPDFYYSEIGAGVREISQEVEACPF